MRGLLLCIARRRLLSSSSSIRLITSSTNTKTLTPTPSPSFSTHRQSSSVNPSLWFQPLQHHHHYCSSPSGPSNILMIESEEQFNSSVRKVEDDSQPAIFYFTAVWCPPCKLLSPIISQLSVKYPNVTTYKVDIDQKVLENVLSKLDINSVPTLHFFLNGKKAYEVVGADVARIKDTMEKLYS